MPALFGVFTMARPKGLEPPTFRTGSSGRDINVFVDISTEIKNRQSSFFIGFFITRLTFCSGRTVQESHALVGGFCVFMGVDVGGGLDV